MWQAHGPGLGRDCTAVPRVLLAVFGCRRGNVAVRGSTKVEAVAEHEKVRFWFLSMDHLSFSCLRTSSFFALGPRTSADCVSAAGDEVVGDRFLMGRIGRQRGQHQLQFGTT
jgi:hypothetical protein